jgi:hypothetical protein
MLILVFGMAVAGRRKGRDDTPEIVAGHASVAGALPAPEALNDKKVDA